jgi:D-galacturonate reductase
MAGLDLDPTPVLMVGTGEYTTGYGASSGSDKKQGVVALTMFDLRKRLGIVGPISMAGTNGAKLPTIRAHMREAIGMAYPGTFTESDEDLRLATYPADDVERDPSAYLLALDALPRGSAVVIFTPDDTHFEIAMAAITRGHHVLVTKPIVLQLAQHRLLLEAAEKEGVLVAVEVHKRWDPMYSDARDRLRRMGSGSKTAAGGGYLNYMSAYMSQPKRQVEVFGAWAGLKSDISYYLNSHHVDFTEYVFGDRGRPISVVARASTGVAENILGRPCEDTITLLLTWENLIPSDTEEGSLAPSTFGTATYTASWAAPKSSDVHSQQRFFCLTNGGEVTVDQAHRGYSQATDAGGFASLNPLFMRYTPSDDGRFVGQTGYGYRSFEHFIRAVNSIRQGKTKPKDFDSGANALATVGKTMMTTAVLEAGRRSLDSGGKEVRIIYELQDPKESKSPVVLDKKGTLDERLLRPVDLKLVA